MTFHWRGWNRDPDPRDRWIHWWVPGRLLVGPDQEEVTPGGDGGGGIDFDQANEGDSLEVVTTGTAKLGLNDDNWDVEIIGDTSNGMLIKDNGDYGIDIESEAHVNINVPDADFSVNNGVYLLQLSDGGSINLDGEQLLVDVGAGLLSIICGDVVLANTGKLGFYGSTGATIPTITGSRGGNAALASLLTALDSIGLIIDSTS